MSDSYKVLARKYRPADFSEVKGQNVLVRTISNAVKMAKIHHAFLLTGIRGVGKTTTARIIAKTLNCTNLNLEREVIVPCGECANCQAFQANKHPDFIEIDAASKTGVSDIREIIDNCRYLPQMSKYKVYVIDEVHMLSINAFNALLKTLEEPPAHVVFIFATTEVRKVPITILSRCQRFDLRRLSQEEIIEHLEYILKLENIAAEKEALEMIAKCSEGSVRDSLSLLDQSIMTNKGSKVTSFQVSQILGIGDKSELVDLLEFIVGGEVEKALNLLSQLYYKGIEPVALINEIIELVNLVTKIKCAGENVQNNYVLSEQELSRIKNMAKNLSVPYLTILWQLSLKAVSEMSYAASVFGAAEMYIIRVSYIADKQMPIDLISNQNEVAVKTIKVTSPVTIEKKIDAPVQQKIAPEKNEIVVKPVVVDEAQATQEIVHENVKIADFRELAQLFYRNKEMILYHHLYEDVHPVKFEPRVLKIRQKGNVPHNFANQISSFLTQWTGNKWVVTLSTDTGDPSLKEIDEFHIEREKNEIAEDRIVKEVLMQFEGTKITTIQKNEQNN